MFWNKDSKRNKTGISYVIVGLGNPGPDYKETRHNMGFLVVDILSQRHNINVIKLKHKALIGDGRMEGSRVMLAKPQTYMNLSGNSVRSIMSYYKISDENLIVIYDDIDIPFGAMRIRKKGSAGSHNGMKSVIGELGTEDFPRIRIGIGAQGTMDLKDFVIGKLTDSEKKQLKPTLERCADAIECIVQKGIDKAMNEYNVRGK